MENHNGKSRRSVGSAFEETAAKWLISQGFRILMHNFFCCFGEIDLIAEENGTLVFVEVKYRKNDAFGDPAEAVNAAKQRKIRTAASYFLMSRGLSDDVSIRFDVVAILGQKIRLYRNAF